MLLYKSYNFFFSNPSDQTTTKGSKNSSNVQLLILSHDDASPLSSTSKSPIEYSLKNSNTDDIAYECGKTISKSKTVHVTVGKTSAETTKSRKETQRSEKKFDVAKDSHIPTRIPAVKAKKPVKLMIPEAVEDAIHKYRMDFIRHIADSPLYANSDVKRPWEVVSRLVRLFEVIIISSPGDAIISPFRVGL